MSGTKVFPIGIPPRPAATTWEFLSEAPQESAYHFTVGISPRRVDIDTHNIEDLHTKLEQWAWSNSNEGFNNAFAVMSRVDPKIIALALLEIPNTVLIAQLLVPFLYGNPSVYQKMIFYLGVYGVRQGRPVYEEIIQLMDSIRVTDADRLSEMQVADLKARTLNVLARKRARGAWPLLHGITGQHEGFFVTGIVQTVDGPSRGNFILYVNSGVHILSKEEKHPARENESYREILYDLWELEGVLRVEEYAEPNGWLVVKTCFEEWEFDHFFDENGVYFLQISISY